MGRMSSDGCDYNGVYKVLSVSEHYDSNNLNNCYYVVRFRETLASTYERESPIANLPGDVALYQVYNVTEHSVRRRVMFKCPMFGVNCIKDGSSIHAGMTILGSEFDDYCLKPIDCDRWSEEVVLKKKEYSSRSIRMRYNEVEEDLSYDYDRVNCYRDSADFNRDTVKKFCERLIRALDHDIDDAENY